LEKIKRSLSGGESVKISLIRVLVLTSVVGLLACTHKGSEKPVAAKLERQQFEGELVPAVREMYAPGDLSECDFRFKDRVLEVAKFLDEKSEEINSKSAALGWYDDSGKELPSIQIGKYKFYESQYTPTSFNWETEEYGWQDIFERIDSGKAGLPEINRRFRGLLASEIDRVQYGLFSGISRGALEPYIQLFKRISDCYLEESCSDPKLTAEQKEFLGQGQYYLRLLSEIETQSDNKHALHELYEHMQADVSFNTFHINENMKQTSPGTFELKMLAGDFSGGEKNFWSFMKYWIGSSGEKISLKIVPSGADLYKFIVEPIYGGRAETSWKKHFLKLYPNKLTRTIAHELGHVFGFPDEYYTTYNYKTCKYKDEYNNGDIMSDSNSGIVMPEHWKTLKEKYPLAN
jgi:hypothetical protein